MQRADPPAAGAKAHAPPASMGSEVMGKVGEGVRLAGAWAWGQRSEAWAHGESQVTGRPLLSVG